MHEHYKDYALINRYGRLGVYPEPASGTPILGRMLNVDNNVADITSTQAYNRYSYVSNNPMKYTDPTGWIKADRNKAKAKTKIADGFVMEYMDDLEELIASLNDGNGFGAFGLAHNSGLPSNFFNSGFYQNTAWGLINAAWNTAMANGYSYNSFTFNNGTLMTSTYGYMGKPYFSEHRQQYGYWTNNVGLFTRHDLQYEYLPIVGQTWHPSSIVDNFNSQMTFSGYGNATIDAGGNNQIDKYFTGLGAMETITDLKNATLEYVGKTSKLVASESKYLSYSKGLGTLAGVAGTAYSGYKILDANLKGQEAEFLDKLDFGVGLTGFSSTLLLTTVLASNPIGLTILSGVALGTTIYGVVRVGMELYDYHYKP